MICYLDHSTTEMISASQDIDDSVVTSLFPKSILKKSPSPRFLASTSTLEIFDSSTDPMDEIHFGSPDQTDASTKKTAADLPPWTRSITRSNPNVSHYGIDRRHNRALPPGDITSDSSSDDQRRRSKFRVKTSLDRTSISSYSSDTGQQSHNLPKSKPNSIVHHQILPRVNPWKSSSRQSDVDVSSSAQFLFDIARTVEQERRIKIDALRRYIEEQIGIAAFLSIYRLIKSCQVPINLHVQPLCSYAKLIPHFCCLIMLETEDQKNL